MAIERLFQVSFECIIDIAFMLVKHFKMGVPSDEEDVFDLLSNKLEKMEKYKEMKRFRNLLVHQYSKINQKIVYRYAREKTAYFQNFISEVKRILNENNR